MTPGLAVENTVDVGPVLDVEAVVLDDGDTVGGRVAAAGAPVVLDGNTVDGGSVLVLGDTVDVTPDGLTSTDGVEAAVPFGGQLLGVSVLLFVAELLERVVMTISKILLGKIMREWWFETPCIYISSPKYKLT